MIISKSHYVKDFVTVEYADFCGCSTLSAGPTIGITWLITVGGQIRPGVLVTLSYEGVKLDGEYSFQRSYFIFFSPFTPRKYSFIKYLYYLFAPFPISSPKKTILGRKNIAPPPLAAPKLRLWLKDLFYVSHESRLL
jgi:hypothetical protein